MSKLLIDDQPLQVLPALAESIGLNEAIILQQIHWLLSKSKNDFEGKYWIYNTYEDWKENHFRFFSVSTIRRAIDKLESLKLIVSTSKFNRMKMDKTKWYTIDYDKLNSLEIKSSKHEQSNCSKRINASVQNEQSSCSKWNAVSVQNEQSNNQETFQENTTIDNNPLPPKGESAIAEGKGQPKNKNIPVDYQGVVNEFNMAVENTPIPQIRVMTEQRKKLVHGIAKLLKKQFGNYDVSTFRGYFDDFVRQACARRDQFYFGGGSTGWTADFEYIMKPKTFVKTLEDAL